MHACVARSCAEFVQGRTSTDKARGEQEAVLGKPCFCMNLRIKAIVSATGDGISHFPMS